MAASHARHYRDMAGVELAACCDVQEERAAAFAEKWGIPRFYIDHSKMLSSERLDGVSIVTPDAYHAPIAIEALESGVAVLSEKPMATNLVEARAMLAAARRSGVIHMVNFTVRESAGLQKAREVIASGQIGRIMHVEASYLQGWLVTTEWGDWRTTPAFTWRLSKKHGSLGVLGDTGCHIFDMATFLCGDISDVYCRLATYDKGIPGNKLGEYDLDANDSFAASVTFANGALGMIHATRWATGILNRAFARVYGDAGTIDVDLGRSPDNYRLFLAKTKEWKTVECASTPTNYGRFVHSIESGMNDVSDFENGYKVQVYLDASLRSGEEQRPVPIEFQAGMSEASQG